MVAIQPCFTITKIRMAHPSGHPVEVEYRDRIGAARIRAATWSMEEGYCAQIEPIWHGLDNVPDFASEGWNRGKQSFSDIKT